MCVCSVQLIGLASFFFFLFLFFNDKFFFCLKAFLDEQFNQLQQLQDENNPDFVVEVVSLFFKDSERLMDELNKAL